jgi:hypothetical protein
MGGAQGTSGTVAVNQPIPSMQAAPMGSSTGGSGLADLYRIQMEAGELENSIASLKNQEQSVVALFNGYLNRQPDSQSLQMKSSLLILLVLSVAVSRQYAYQNPYSSMLRI